MKSLESNRINTLKLIKMRRKRHEVQNLFDNMYVPKFTFKVELPRLQKDMLTMKKRSFLSKMLVEIEEVFSLMVYKIRNRFLKRQLDHRIKNYLNPEVVIFDADLDDLNAEVYDSIETMRLGSSLCLPVRMKQST